VDDLLKKDFMNIVECEISKYDRHKIYNIAKATGHSVLRLQPYHSKMKQISFFWHKVNAVYVKHSVYDKHNEIIDTVMGLGVNKEG
jgi:hypothetical protein